jgi:AcrR family transcriptional regulator
MTIFMAALASGRTSCILVNMFTTNNPSSNPPEGRPPGRRRRGRPRGASPRSAATRASLYETAVALFAEHGYEATTLREIAAKADVSPALLYRYFPSKRSVVLELYDELSAEFQQRAREQPSGKWRERFAFTLRTSLETLRPHRGTLVALVPAMVGGRDEGLFAPAAAFSRDRVQAAFVAAVVGAKDAPKGDDAASLGRALDLVHLGVLLWWLLDKSDEQRATKRLLGVVEGVLPAFALAFRLRVVRGLVRDLDALAREAFHGEAAA